MGIQSVRRKHRALSRVNKTPRHAGYPRKFSKRESIGSRSGAWNEKFCGKARIGYVPRPMKMRFGCQQLYVFKRELPPLDYLRECFRADFGRGKLFWKCRPRDHFETDEAQARCNSENIDCEAGFFKDGRMRVTINGRSYLFARVILAMSGIEVWRFPVVHVNGNVRDCRFSNLRIKVDSEHLDLLGL